MFQNMALSYRLYRDDDFPRLERLWREDAEWGDISAVEYRRFFRQPGPLIAIAEDPVTGAIVGQAFMVPHVCRVKGRDIPAYRLSIPFLAKGIRCKSIDVTNLPVVRLFGLLWRTLKERGVGITYSVEGLRWQLLRRIRPPSQPGMTPTAHASFPIWTLPLPLPQLFVLDPIYKVASLKHWDDRVARLWDIVSRRYPCQLVRDSRTLTERADLPDFAVLGLERNEELVGLVCSRPVGRQWLICDVLATDEDATRATLMAVANLAHAKAREPELPHPIVKTSILAIPALQPALASLGFQSAKYQIDLGVRVLDPSIELEDVDPARWYLSQDD